MPRAQQQSPVPVPPREVHPMKEFVVPPVGTSPITGIQGTINWGGINRPDSRSRWVINDADLDDLINMLPQGVQLQQVPYKGAVIATLPSTIIWMQSFILFGTPSLYCLCANGHIYQVTTLGVVTDIYAVSAVTLTGTITGGQPTITSLPSTSALFVGETVTGLFIPAGAKILTIDSSTQVTMSVNATGSGSTTEPITFQPPLFSINPPCDITDWETTEIIISDPAAEAVYSWNGTTFTVVFSNQPASSIVIFENRLWMAFGLTLTWTQGDTYNSLAGDAGSVVLTDADTASNIIHMVAVTGSLLLFGSSWIKSISGLNELGSPAVLTFNLVTVAQGSGLIPGNPYSTITFSNYLYYANAYGLWQLSGSALVKLSLGLDGFFQNLDFSKTNFSVAYGEIYETPVLLWQAYYNGDGNVDPGYTLFGATLQSGAPTQWFRIVQGTLTYIAGVPAWTSSNLPMVYGTDGTDIFPMFQDILTAHAFTVDTKIWDINGSKIDYRTWDSLALFCPLTTTTTISIKLIGTSGRQLGNTLGQTNPNPRMFIWTTPSGGLFTWYNSSDVIFIWTIPLGFAYNIFQYKIGFDSRGLGLNITGTGAQTILQSIVIGYRETDTSFGP
jgi:hypothetical protein